ncbi:uncharacterized protein LOC127155272 isoform X2 [Labeo rohita]|uniref:uncharacterized protein LOC127155272 isoform X2 n=1 Tax=Labeo rohita TaxID=84645 RepID=UPI0021E278E0|nr:uncharacterized protein LOC127155272 isoform X2 [Labeo rohita]
MGTYCVLLHIFAALLLCDNRMFCEPHLVMSTTAISDMSDSNTTVTTAESTIVGNDSTPLASGLENDWSNNSSADYPHTTQILKHGQTNESILDAPQTTESVRGSETKGGIPFEVSSSTAHPKQDSTSKGTKATNGDTGAKSGGSGSLTGGIIILIFILILIVCLLVILYFLRKKSRSYSFDLSRPDVASNDYVDTPLSIDQQGISYEPTTKDLPMCLDYLNEDNTEEKTNPIANGSTGEQTEQTPTNESDFQNFPEENSFSSDSSLASPMKKVEFNLDLDLLGSDSELNNTTEAEATNTEQNENNNNVSNAGQGTAAEIFTEISLDEPKQHA